MTVEDYDPLFSGLKKRLVPLLSKIMDSNIEIPRLPEDMTFHVDGQEEFCKKVSNAMGFDFDALLSVKDGSRFTTRFDEKDPFSCLYAVICAWLMARRY